LNNDRERDVKGVAALVGVAAAAFAGIAAPAAMASRGLALPVRVSGSVVATWQGDPARGCAAAGVCGSSGSATSRPGFDGRLRVSRNSVGFGGSQSPEPSVVRVRQGGPGAPVACADVLGSFFSPLSFEFLGNELQVTLDGLELSAGRCAGPRTLDLSHAFPRGSIKTRLLRTGSRVLDLSSRTRFVAGPFSGEVISTVKVALGQARVVRGDASPDILRLPLRGGTPQRYWVLALQYRIAGFAGALVTDFRGIPDPACQALGACGATGSSSYSLKDVSGRVDVLAGGRLRRGRNRPKMRSALRMLHRGRLSAYADSRLWRARATVSETVASSDSSCSDSLFAEPPIVDSRSSRKGLVLLLRSDDLGSPSDTLRTRCPGPSQSDVLGDSSLAHGAIPFGALGAPRIHVTAGADRMFAKNGYTGARHGRLELDLELVKSRVSVGQ
jgi:hypothetical protein